MKRYLIFAAIGPRIGGFLLLLATTVSSGYWTETNWSEVGKFLAAFVKTLPYGYLFGIVPALMMAAIDDILFHVPRIKPTLRTVIMACLGVVLAQRLPGSPGPVTGDWQLSRWAAFALVA